MLDYWDVLEEGGRYTTLNVPPSVRLNNLQFGRDFALKNL